ncbi:MAG: hypothetical protein RSA29_02580 [Clostridium sp.]|uniref:hypothetical protein n=1 Tax=Clostridium sp. TaxID=1506 RepID=UPI0030598271
MARIYLGTTIDINKEQYLPIMQSKCTEINSFQNDSIGVMEFDADSIISCSKNSISIRDSYSLAVKKTIIPLKSIVNMNTNISAYSQTIFPLAISTDKNKIYCVTSSDNTSYYLSEYNLTTNSWTERLLAGSNITSTYMNFVTQLYVDNEYAYIYVNNYAKMFKISLTDSTLVSQATIGGTSYSIVAFDGSYFYSYSRTTATGCACSKYSKTTLQSIASSATIHDSLNSSYPAVVQYIIVKDNYVYLACGKSTQVDAMIKLNKDTLNIVASLTQVNIVATRFDVSSNRIICTGTNGSKDFYIELNIDTLAITIPLTEITFKNSTLYAYAHDKSDTFIVGGKVQIEKSYTIQSYKKVKGSVI